MATIALRIFIDIWLSGMSVRFSVKRVASVDPSAARMRVTCEGGAVVSSLGRLLKNCTEPSVMAPAVVAAGTIRPATRTPQSALTPRNTSTFPRVVLVSRNRAGRVDVGLDAMDRIMLAWF
ncbi:hypothetical protein GCM10012320_29610 [Sinomonas cellulolyticus]|nr:hypothetical protein GCM10012320_29610 [Sinomonas sp. KCTC 49339]